MTEVSSNTATAIIMTPVVIAITGEMQFDPRPFIFGVCFASSASFSTPVGYQTNLMVYGPGGYKFSDYMRVGIPLALTFLGFSYIDHSDYLAVLIGFIIALILIIIT